jgi:hypothetical protein
MFIILQRRIKTNKWNTDKTNQNSAIIGKFKFELTVFLSLISYADCSKNVFNEQDHLLVLIEKKEPNDHSIVAHPLRRHE